MQAKNLHLCHGPIISEEQVLDAGKRPAVAEK